jgi:hypothetical protein
MLNPLQPPHDIDPSDSLSLSLSLFAERPYEFAVLPKRFSTSPIRFSTLLKRVRRITQTISTIQPPR